MGKRIAGWAWIACAAVVLLPGASLAAGWEDFLRALSGGDISAQPQSGTFYNADYSFTVTDADGNPSNFSATDTVALTVSSATGKLTLTFPGGTKAQLTDWAEANADKLFKILFGGAPESSISGETTASLTATAQAARYMESAQIVTNHDIRTRVQYDFFKVGPQENDARGSSGLIGYSSVIGEKGTSALGVELQYRTMRVDDGYDSDMLFLMLNPYYEYSDTYGATRWVLGGGLNGGLTKLSSDAFGDGGYFQFGGNVGAGAGRTLATWLEARASLSYQYLDRYIPSDWVDGDFQWIVDALNDMDAEQTITPAVGVTVWFLPQTLSFEGNVFRVHQVGGGVPEGSRYQTVINTFLTYTPGNWRILGGYKTSFEVEDFTDRSVVASVQYLW